MRELFYADGKQKLDPNGAWIKGDLRVYEWFCCSKKHKFTNPDLAQSCCKFVQKRGLDNDWIETPIFDLYGKYNAEGL